AQMGGLDVGMAPEEGPSRYLSPEKHTRPVERGRHSVYAGRGPGDPFSDFLGSRSGLLSQFFWRTQERHTTRKRKYDLALGGILGPGSPCPDYPITGFGCCATAALGGSRSGTSAYSRHLCEVHERGIAG